MKIQNRSRFLTWALIVLLVMNLFALGTILFHLRNDKPVAGILPPKRPESAQQIIMQELHLSPEQFQLFREYRHQFMVESREIVSELDYQRQLMLDKLAEQEPDTSELNRIAANIGNLHKQLKEETIRNFLDLKSICTPEQQDKLDRLFQNMMDMEGPFRRGSGQGRKFRWRHGNMNNR